MAKKKKNLTVFQRMNNMFGPDGVNVPKDQTNRYSIGNKELLKTTDKGEYDRAKEQAQQNKYLGGLWKKVDGELFQQSIHYETTRIGSYSDFENMEFYPEIASALDTMMEEATTVNDKGEVINIYSDSKRVKKILKDLFHNRLDIHTSLPMWTRNTCKYGDDFVYLNIDDKAGIIGARQMPNYEMERREGSIYDAISRQHMAEDGDDGKVKFYWKGRDVEFSSWQIAHFRLLGDDRRLPYGTCLKYNSRVETKDGYKEIKDIVKGDLVYSFDELTQTKVLSEVLDTINSGTKKTYKLSTAHNFIDVSKEHKVMYYDTELDKFDYKNTLDFKIGDLLVIDKVNNNSTIIPIIKNKPESNKNGFWNNVELIPDFVNTEFAEFFGYLIGDGWIHNDSVFIALSEHKTINDKYISYMNKVTGRDIKFSGGDSGKSQAICNSKSLSIILKDMGFVGDVYSKRLPTWIYNSSKEVREAFLTGLIDSDGSLFIDKWNCLRYSIELANEELINDIKVLVQSLGLKSGKICSRLRKDGGIGDRKFKTQQQSFYFYFYESNVKQKNKYDLIDNRLTDEYILEPIKSIEESGEHETYDIYVEDNNHNFYANGIVVHNSVLEKARRIWKQLLLSEDAMLIYRVTRAPERRVYKIYVGNIDEEDVPAYVDEIANRFKRSPVIDPQTGQIDLKYNQMANDQDFFIPVRTEDAPNPIDTLAGAQNLDQIADIEYLQRKLFTALRVPKSFLGFEEAIGEGKNLAMQDIRFSRTINRIQQAMIMELNKIAIIHLYLLGFEDELDNFTLTLNNPSVQAEMLKVEHLQAKMTLYKDAVTDAGNGFGGMSMTKAKREILGWSDDEIKQDLLEQRMEKAAAAELANTAAVIKNTGIFDKVDKIYGDIEIAKEGGQVAGEEGDEGGPSGGGGGGFGGGGFGEEDMDFGEDGGAEGLDAGGEGLDLGADEGGEEVDVSAEAETTEESIKQAESLLTEQKALLQGKQTIRKAKQSKSYIDRLTESIKIDKRPNLIREKIYDKNLTINEDVNNMIKDIDKMVEDFEKDAEE